jgi:virginiamycin B lyase
MARPSTGERTFEATARGDRLHRRGLLLVAALLVLALVFASRADAYIYWANPDGDAIGRANLDGTGANPSFITGADNPLGVAVDGVHVYWTNGTNTIGRANLDGTGANPSFIAAPISDLGSGVAVDNAHVYWVSTFANTTPNDFPPPNPGTGAIGRANLDGSGVDRNFIAGISFPTGSVAVGASHLYWTSYHPDTNFSSLYFLPARIGRVNLNGTEVEENFISTLPAGVAVDEAHVWWAFQDRFDGGIERANLDGAGAEFVIERRENFFPCGIAVDDTYVYWTEGESIGRARLDGSRATDNLIADTRTGCAVAVDALGPSPSNGFRFGGVKVNKKRGSAKLTVKVPGPGELKLAKTGSVKGKHKRAKESGNEKLSVKAKGKAKKRLNRKGKAMVKAKVTYTPDGGTPNTQSKKLKLKKR